ncbi:MAG: PAS domain-containing protein, partial [Myxococcales bacterium]|nr:PAS domain-containing protein [Myxococcales bacterium]
MSPPRGLPPAVFADAFPFHLWLDAELRVIQAGAVLRRLLPELRPGAAALKLLRLSQPACEPTPEALRAIEQAVELVYDDMDMRIRGQLLVLEDDTLLLLLWPTINDEDELAALGLSLDDFPHHSTLRPQLALLRELWDSLQESQDLVVDLEAEHRQLLQSRRRIDLLLQHTPLGIIDWNNDGRITAWNPAAAAIFAVPEARAIGSGIEVLGIERLSSHEHSQDYPVDELLGHTGERVITEHLRGQQKVLGAWHNTPLFDSEGRPLGTTSVVRDVTESVRVEQTRRERQRLEGLALLAGGIAH